MLVLVCCDNVRRTFPVNLICLMLFTLLQSFLLGSAASFYDSEAVLIAVGICAVICLGLTFFAFQTKWDFTMCSGMLLVALLVLIVFGFLAACIPSKVISIVYASLGAAIFSM
ncbi:protein lifeguard 1-like, partial [Centruroides sculpturatus]|uniref:protein lifeguard 1-like n=1 Tax=Centruroides sculpturatus TaxID=218467 RepID=UPI000C6E334A